MTNSSIAIKKKEQEDAYLSLNQYPSKCLKLNGLTLTLVQNFNRSSISVPPIMMLDVTDRGKSDTPFVNSRLIYQEDFSAKVFNFHVDKVAKEILKIAPSSQIYLLSPKLQTTDKYHSHIINFSAGIDTPDPINKDYTYKFLEIIYTEEAQIFLSNLESYLKIDLPNLGVENLPDEYFLKKHADIMIEIALGTNNFSDFLNLFKKRILENFNQERKSVTDTYLIGKNYLIIQSLSNREGDLTPETCTFTNLDKNNFERRKIIFVKNLFFSVKKSKIISPSSEIPGPEFADRTICVVLPVDETQDLPDDLLFISNNSQAAPWVSACAYFINILYLNKEKQFSPLEVSDCILKTATPYYQQDGQDKITIQGQECSSIYGKGILNFKAALEYAEQKF